MSPLGRWSKRQDVPGLDLLRAMLKAHSKSHNSRLCKRCQIWDDIWEFEAQRGDYRSLEELSRSFNCLVCQAVVRAINTRRGESPSLLSWQTSRILVTNDGPYFLDLGHFPAKVAHRYESRGWNRTVIRCLMSLNVSFIADDLDLPTTRQDVLGKMTSSIAITPQFCLTYSKGNLSHLKSIEAWEISFFHVSLLKTWLRGCENVHGSKCVEEENSSDLPAGFRVINVHTMNLIEPLEPVRYVALSYMWQQSGDKEHLQLERQNLNDLETLGGITNVPLPSIITDALALCKGLGETYLWIDRLCIIQDDPDSKHSQISGMDKIYRSASFTIIVALNTRDGGGIPGCPGQPRRSSIWSPPRDTEVEGRGIKPNGMSYIGSTLWNSRGWTFQERVLSRRRLFITEFQVIFECSQGHAMEELSYYPQRPYEEKEHNFTNQPSPNSKKEKEDERREYTQIPTFTKPPMYSSTIDYNMKSSISLADYLNWVEDYTSRQLSFGSDILKAFGGVGNALSESLDTQLVFGLPEKFLPQALMWSNLGIAQRRTEMPEIPSWSWASSIKGADYSWMLDRSRSKGDLEKVASIVYFYYQDPHQGLRKLGVGERWIGHEISIEEFENCDELPSLAEGHGKYVPGGWRSNETWQQSPHNPWTALKHHVLDPDACIVATKFPGSLIFSTTVASLSLSHDTRDIYKTSTSSDRDVMICNQQGEQVGVLNKMSPEWINEHVGVEKSYYFIILCGALENWSTRKNKVQYNGDFDLWNLHVMMVERLDFEPSVVRRIDVGCIAAHKWKYCDPRWETVVLC